METELENWNIKYQPKTLQEIEGHLIVKMQIQSAFDNNEITHFLLYGEAGTGKSMLASIIAEMHQERINKYYDTPFSDDFDEGDIKTYDASVDRGIDIIRGEIKERVSGAGKGTIILDEADMLTIEAQNALRGTMDKALKKNKMFILTGNFVDKFGDPILSRCRILHVGRLTDNEILSRLVFILRCEEVPVRTEQERDYILQIAKYSDGDMRKAINSLQMSVNFGKLDIKQEYMIILDEAPTLITLFDNVIKQGAFKGLREELILLLYENTTRIDKYRIIKQISNWVTELYEEGDMEEIYYLKCMISVKDCDYRLSRATSAITQMIGMFAELRIVFLQFTEGDKKH